MSRTVTGLASTHCVCGMYIPSYSTHDCDFNAQKVAALEAEVVRLRVCGNCGHIYEDDSGASIGFLFCGELAVSPWSRVCQYVPSRWTAREEGGDE